MNRRNKIILIFFMVVMFSVSIWNHEITHGVIYSYTGCPNASYGFENMTFYTKCLNNTYYNREIGNALHGQNEIIGYNLMPHLVIIEVLLVWLIFKE